MTQKFNIFASDLKISFLSFNKVSVLNVDLNGLIIFDCNQTKAFKNLCTAFT